jgi:hypothetical protein
MGIGYGAQYISLESLDYFGCKQEKNLSVALASTFALASHSKQKSYEGPIHTHITTYLLALAAYIQNRNIQEGK